MFHCDFLLALAAVAIKRVEQHSYFRRSPFFAGVFQQIMEVKAEGVGDPHARNGGYPCPAAPVGSPDDTKLDCAALDPAAIRQAGAKAGHKIVEGAVLYKQLSIPRESTLPAEWI